jgi:hypothetical protein
MPILSTLGAGSSKGFNPGAMGLVPGATTILDASTYTSGSTVTDLSGSGLNGTLIGGVTKSSLNGGAFLFDGKSGYIRTGPVPNSGTAGTSWSMGVWVSPNTQWGNVVSMAALDPSDGWQMPPIRVEAQRLAGQVWSNAVQPQSAAFTMGSWNYVVLVWDAATSQTRFYLNGSRVSTNTSASYNSSGVNNFISLGKAITQAVQDTGWFSGYISHYHFYGAKALSDSDVLTNYNLLLARHSGTTLSGVVTSNLGMYLDTNRTGSYNANTTWSDLSGNSLNAVGSVAGQLTILPVGNATPTLTGGLLSNGAFPGGGSWPTASTALLNDDTHTIMFWIKFNSSTAYPNGWSGNWEKIFGFNPPGSDRAPSIWRFPTQRYIHWRYDPANTGADLTTTTMFDNASGPEFELDTWYNVCITKNGATATGYVNGVSVGTRTVSNPKTSGNSAINLFEYYTPSSAQMDGMLIYSSVLSDAEVLQNYNALKGRYKAVPTTYKKVFEIDFNNPASYPGSGSSVFEVSGRQLTGTATNATYSATNGGSLSFNGSTSFMAFPYDAIHDVAGNGVTAEVWIKPTSLSQNGFLIEKGQVNSQYSLFLDSTNLRFRTVTSGNGLTDIAVASASFMNTTEWHHVVGTYSSGVKKLYINGVLISTQTNITGTINNNGNGIWLGKHAIPDSYFYNGLIGEARVYNRQLSDDQVLYNFNTTKARYNRTSTPAQPLSTVSGGSLTSDATYYYRRFTSTDTLTVTGANLTADVLVVAGAGAGGSSAGGGGGAGGMVEAASYSIPAGAHTVTIGAGGTATPTNGNGNPGNATTLGSLLTANGGGRGTAWGGGSGSVHDGGSGGGGGAGPGPQIGGTKTQGSGAGFTGYGNNGGTGAGGGGQAGGGGGAGSAGTNGGAGSGRSNSYSGSAVTYAAGGVPGFTGIVSGTYASGGANTGNGGQGSTDNKTAGNGGSGVVVIRYLRSQIVGG